MGNSARPNSSIIQGNTLGQNSPAAGGTRSDKTRGLAGRTRMFLAVPGIGLYDSGDIRLWTPLHKSGTQVSASQANPQQLVFSSVISRRLSEEPHTAQAGHWLTTRGNPTSGNPRSIRTLVEWRMLLSAFSFNTKKR